MPIPVVVIAGAKSLLPSVSRLLGNALTGQFGLPRGDFKKFERTIFPVMLRQAQISGISSHAFWFGDVVEITPNANIATPIIRARVGTLNAANQFWLDLQITEAFNIFRCTDPVDFNSLDDVGRKCSFVRVGPTVPGTGAFIPPILTKVGLTSELVVPLGIGAGIIALAFVFR